MFRYLHLFPALGLAAAVAAGCGGDDTSTGAQSGAFSTGLPKDQVVGTVSDADNRRICDAIGEYARNDPGIRSAQCRIGGIGVAVARTFFGAATDADVQKACSDFESMCMNAMPTSADAGTSSCQKPPATCTVTVGEFEACLSDSFAALQTQVQTLPSCATLKVADVTPQAGSPAGPAQVPVPASCAVVNEKCPGVVQSTTGGGATGS